MFVNGISVVQKINQDMSWKMFEKL